MKIFGHQDFIIFGKAINPEPENYNLDLFHCGTLDKTLIRYSKGG